MLHVLNLIVQDDLSEIVDITEKKTKYGVCELFGCNNVVSCTDNSTNTIAGKDTDS